MHSLSRSFGGLFCSQTRSMTQTLAIVQSRLRSSTGNQSFPNLRLALLQRTLSFPFYRRLPCALPAPPVSRIARRWSRRKRGLIQRFDRAMDVLYIIFRGIYKENIVLRSGLVLSL